MATFADEKPLLLVKKFAGVLLLLAGLLVTAFGFGGGSNGLGILGLLLLAVGVVLLVLKVIRRNEGGQF
jgi:hypothetical protein